jgi:dihydroorotate dehydrogenase electron transfer subunit
MACGVGACLGCVTRDGDGHHVQVCTKGPVFWSDKVEL